MPRNHGEEGTSEIVTEMALQVLSEQVVPF